MSRLMAADRQESSSPLARRRSPYAALPILLLLALAAFPRLGASPSLAQTAEAPAQDTGPPAPLSPRPDLGQVEPTSPLPPFQLPDFAGRTVSGEGVVDLADFISGCLADAGVLPDFAQVQTADGRLRRISAAEAFALLARTADLWQTMGQLPETVPLAPDGLRGPIIDPEDVPELDADLSLGREIPTEQFLAQSGPTVRWIDRLHVIPTAVWVDGQRLSAAEYLAGLAVCIQYAYWEGELYDLILLPQYTSPLSWTRGFAARTGRGPTAPSQQGQQSIIPSDQAGPERAAEEAGPPTAQALTPTEPEPVPLPVPQLALFPRPGSTLSGAVDLVATYSGPPARFVTFAIDGVTRAIINLPPYSHRWDTSALVPGHHTVRVQVLGDEDLVLVDQLCGFPVVSPEREQPKEELLDDL